MNFQNYTIKSQEVVQEALKIAEQRSNPNVEPIHVLQAINKVGESITNFIFSKCGANTQLINQESERLVGKLPRVTGGDTHISNYTVNALLKAEDFSKQAGDEFVSVEYIFLGLFENGDEVAEMLKRAGLSKNVIVSAINELRGGDKVKSQNAEDNYKSLSKYAINLNERARSGKLDPVIGRDEEIRRVLQILSRRTKNNRRTADKRAWTLLVSHDAALSMGLMSSFAYCSSVSVSRMPMSGSMKRYLMISANDTDFFLASGWVSNMMALMEKRKQGTDVMFSDA